MIGQNRLMAAIGNNYAKRHERPSLTDYNKAWAAKRGKALDQSKQLRSTMSNAIFNIGVTASQQSVYNSMKGASYGSNAAALSRLNILV
jgi:hypothetical protein